jgi:hypothetical protein
MEPAMHSHDRTLLAKLGFADPDKKDPRHDRACQYLALPENARRLAAMVQADTRGREVSERDRRGKGVWSVCWRPILEHAVTKGKGQYMSTIGFVDLLLEVTVRERFEGEQIRTVSVSRTVTVGEYRRWERIPGRDLSVGPDGTLWRLPYQVDPYARHRQEGGEPFGSCRNAATPLPVGYRCGCGATFVAHDDHAEIVVQGSKDEWQPVNSEIVGWPVEWEAGQWSLSAGHGQAVAVEVKIGQCSIGDILRQVALYRGYLNAAAWVLATPWAVTAADRTSLEQASIHHIRLGPKFDEWCAAQRNPTEPPPESPEF